MTGSAVLFDDRRDAGRQLAAAFGQRHLRSPLVLALPRGGVPVAAVVADELDAPLDVVVARKIGAPGQPEFGIGAVAEGSDRMVLADQAGDFDLSDRELTRLAAKEHVEVERRVDRYRDGQPLPDVDGRSVIVVDDGVATGVTAEAAIRSLACRAPFEIILAVPVCAPEAARTLGEIAEIVSLHQPSHFEAVGRWYRDFAQVTDDEVVDLLGRTSTATFT